MTIGAALFTIAVGAVLAIGALGLVFGLWMNSRAHAAGPPPGY